MDNPDNLKVGVTTYHDFYSHEQLDEIESLIMETENKSLNDGYLPMTA